MIFRLISAGLFGDPPRRTRCWLIEERIGRYIEEAIDCDGRGVFVDIDPACGSRG